jgi:D-alanine-D-alanine ligase
VLQPPYVVKPNAEGSSVGVFIVFGGREPSAAEVGPTFWTFGEEVMVEPYIRGLELAVAVMGESKGPGRWR